jgi:hypothetical protein
MGYFNAAYVVEMEDRDDGVAITRTHYGTVEGERILFFWSDRPWEGLYPLANGTLRCSTELYPTFGYPSTDIHGNGRGEDQDTVLVDEDFSGLHDDSLFLFHFLLPARFVPCPDRLPLDVPSEPSVIIRPGDRLSATFIARGTARLRFWMRRMSPDETLQDYELARLFNKPVAVETKATMEINLGILKFSIGNK